MPLRPQPVLEPRKSPVQARSTASVDAILEAALQVLAQVGKEKLTTTRVATRAGVSVGTLYQYFPNKSSLLRAALERHLDQVAAAMHNVARQSCGQPIEPMMTALMTTFLDAKMHNPRASTALYAVSADLDSAIITQRVGHQIHQSILALIQTLPQPLTTDATLVASMIQGVMNGVSRRLLESPAPEQHLPALKRELIFLASTYLHACSHPAPPHTITP